MLVIDIECDYVPNLSPFNKDLNLEAVGVYSTTTQEVYKPTYKNLKHIERLMNNASVIAGHNLKFDLHWLKRYGVKWDKNIPLWDTQAAEYVLTGQHSNMMHLNELSQQYLGRQKIDVIKRDYWDKGIQTKDIPWPELSEYCLTDCELTWLIAQKQMTSMPSSLKPLFRYAMMDYHLLQEMEYFGTCFDREESLSRVAPGQKVVDDLVEEFSKAIDFPNFNFASPKQLSALLFGGTLEYVRKVPSGVNYKTGKRKGQIKCKNETVEVVFKRQYAPGKKNKPNAAGQYATGEKVLKSLRTSPLLEAVLTIRKKSKLVSGYYKGLPALQDEYGWRKDRLFGSLKPAQVITGRLASAQPNLQNFAGEAKCLMVSRYASKR